jgi:hypothetical protein
VRRHPLKVLLWLSSLFCISLSTLPRPAAGQVAWDVPSLVAPGAPSGLSVLLLDAYPSDELGVLATWRTSPAPVGIGFRGGLADQANGDLAGLFGLDVSGPVASLEGAGDPTVIWWAGAGLGVGDELLLSFPLGLVFGWRGTNSDVTFRPYAGAHLTLDVVTGPGDDLDLGASIDLGLDLGFRSGFMVRFGASVGDRDALAVGVRLPH